MFNTEGMFSVVFMRIPEFDAVEIVEKSWEKTKHRLGEKLGEKLGKTEWKILELVFNFNTITIDKMADTLGISTTAIENNIRKLKGKELLFRVGSPKGGFWTIGEY